MKVTDTVTFGYSDKTMGTRVTPESQGSLWLKAPER